MNLICAGVVLALLPLSLFWSVVMIPVGVGVVMAVILGSLFIDQVINIAPKLEMVFRGPQRVLRRGRRMIMSRIPQMPESVTRFKETVTGTVARISQNIIDKFSKIGQTLIKPVKNIVLKQK